MNKRYDFDIFLDGDCPSHTNLEEADHSLRHIELNCAFLELLNDYFSSSDWGKLGIPMEKIPLEEFVFWATRQVAKPDLPPTYSLPK